MEKQYTIPAELFQQLKDVISILRLPHIMQHISKVDKMTARDLVEISMKLDQIETRRMLNSALRMAYRLKDINALGQIRALKRELCDEPDEVDAVG